MSPGGAGANLYHRAVADFLAAIFYPHLVNKKIEKEINEGRKRIDIAFDNLADDGFFRFISRHYMASQVVIECKNYTTDPSNHSSAPPGDLRPARPARTSSTRTA